METGIVYCAQAALWAVALWRVGVGASVVVLALNVSGSWIVGDALDGYSRATAMNLLDLGLILAMRAWGSGARDRIIAALALGMIFCRSSYMAAPYIDRHSYAAALNCAVALQLIVCGGMADGFGQRIDDWLARVWPWGSRALRYVAT